LERKVDKQPDRALAETAKPSAAPQNVQQEQANLPALVEIAPAGAPETTTDNENNLSEEIVAPPGDGAQLLPLNDVPLNDMNNPENGSIQDSGSDSVVQVNEAISVVVSDPVSGESAR
jgi:hypothetical protein